MSAWTHNEGPGWAEPYVVTGLNGYAQIFSYEYESEYAANEVAGLPNVEPSDATFVHPVCGWK